MIFLLIGALLLVLKLGEIDPVAHWSWIAISCPFFVAILWLEFIEPLLGLDIKRQQREQLRFLKRFHNKNDYLSRESIRKRRIANRANSNSTKK